MTFTWHISILLYVSMVQNLNSQLGSFFTIDTSLPNSGQSHVLLSWRWCWLTCAVMYLPCEIKSYYCIVCGEPQINYYWFCWSGFGKSFKRTSALCDTSHVKFLVSWNYVNAYISLNISLISAELDQMTSRSALSYSLHHSWVSFR